MVKSLQFPILDNLYINDTPQTHSVHLVLFADNTCLYVTECKENYILRKLQHSLNSTVAWCQHWNMKINVDKTRLI
jgi:hypothetical protein